MKEETTWRLPWTADWTFAQHPAISRGVRSRGPLRLPANRCQKGILLEPRGVWVAAGFPVCFVPLKKRVS